MPDVDAPSDLAPTLLSLAEAAQAVGTTVQALWLRVQRGELQIHRVLEHGRTSTAVALKDILGLYMEHVPAEPMPQARPTYSPPPAFQAPHPAPAAAPQPTAAPAPGYGPEAGFEQSSVHAPAPIHAPAPAAYEMPRPVVDETPRPSSAVQSPLTGGSRPPAPDTFQPGFSAAAGQGALRENTLGAAGPQDDAAVARQAAQQAALEQAAARAATDALMVDNLRSDLDQERMNRAQLEGKLESLREIEGSARRYAERLESRLEQTEHELSEAKREALTLARALGQAEGQVLHLSGGETPEGGGSSNPSKRKRRRKRRWWR